jgi:hypothetical protein
MREKIILKSRNKFSGAILMVWTSNTGLFGQSLHHQFGADEGANPSLEQAAGPQNEARAQLYEIEGD